MRAMMILLWLGACAQFPALDGAISDSARALPYPKLTAIPPTDLTSTEDQAALQARIDALNARAEVLRKTDIAALQ